ncbi:putative SH3 and PX domain-containing protein 2A-like [Apostichopus japonicus]|uniref:Putative SH3 and PX domain-containing protein 2A-like n=1 Tax=Stichopus japonicus TaxID=307972 RepID=A0A2G8JLE7_STIJA|nr:putative SH3 and PX domain-containing protein 2A-like [Apostichopus japonicus]
MCHSRHQPLYHQGTTSSIAAPSHSSILYGLYHVTLFQKSIKNAVQRERKKSEYKTTAPFDGSSSSDDCVSFKAQQIVEVIHKYEEWWFIKVEGREGWAPASYIQTRESPEKGNYTPPAPANISRKGPIDPNRGGSTVSTDSETGAPEDLNPLSSILTERSQVLLSRIDHSHL